MNLCQKCGTYHTHQCLGVRASQPSTAIPQNVQKLVGLYQEGDTVTLRYLTEADALSFAQAMGSYENQVHVQGNAFLKRQQPSPAHSDKDAGRVKDDADRTFATACHIEETRAAFEVAFKVDLWAVKSWIDNNGFCSLQKRDPAGQAERAPSGESPTIVDCDGIPQALRAVIETKGHVHALTALYKLIDAWGARRATVAPSGESIANDERFAVLVGAWKGLLDHYEDSENPHVLTAWGNLVAHIDARRATAGNAAPTECDFCEGGKGAHDGGYWVECPQCNGTGRISSAELCADCNQSGILPGTANNTATAAPGDLPPLHPLPRPKCTYADHSYPAFTKGQMEDYAREYGRACIASNAGAALSVPREPTQAMKDAAYAYREHMYGNQQSPTITGYWLAMFDAAPSTSPVGAKEKE
jgi:hypothetical protein